MNYYEQRVDALPYLNMMYNVAEGYSQGTCSTRKKINRTAKKVMEEMKADSKLAGVSFQELETLLNKQDFDNLTKELHENIRSISRYKLRKN